MKPILLAWLAALAFGQQPGLSITADVDHSVAALNEQIVMSVTVTGSRTDLPDPELPSMPNMSVYSSGRSQNISFVNGQVSSSIIYTYVLVPRFVGKADIPPIGITVDGRHYIPARGRTSPARPTCSSPPRWTGPRRTSTSR
ncbi:MAG: BatD family protein [Elusimicrobia bacterium]|nr:BatD family protein [Elusimicrobiota bacterium]